jgi:hypothetical protein
MSLYTTVELDSIPTKFNSINRNIEESINQLVNSFDYDKLNLLIISIRDEYGELKNKIAEFSVELRINVLEIDELKIFDRYKKYCSIRLKAIHRILEPHEIDFKLNSENDKFLTHADLSKYSNFHIPEILNIYNLSGYLYSYSFMLLVLKKSIIGIVDNLQFQDLSNDDLSIFDSTVENAIDSPFKISNKKGVRTDLIRILHTLYELRFIEDIRGQIPTKKEFMLKVGEFLGTNFSSYDSDLSQSLNNTTIEKNTEIFKRMIVIMEKSHHTNKKK